MPLEYVKTSRTFSIICVHLSTIWSVVVGHLERVLVAPLASRHEHFLAFIHHPVIFVGRDLKLRDIADFFSRVLPNFMASDEGQNREACTQEFFFFHCRIREITLHISLETLEFWSVEYRKKILFLSYNPHQRWTALPRPNSAKPDYKAYDSLFVRYLIRNDIEIFT